MRPSRRVTTSGCGCSRRIKGQTKLLRPNCCRETWRSQWCLAHVFHRMVKFQVQQLYNGKYFGSLAKVVNLWRSHKNPMKKREGLRQYHHDHGDRATDTRAQKLPPRSLTGRWGAVSNSEKYVRAFTQNELVYVWEEMLVFPGVWWSMIPWSVVFNQPAFYT